MKHISLALMFLLSIGTVSASYEKDVRYNTSINTSDIIKILTKPENLTVINFYINNSNNIPYIYQIKSNPSVTKIFKNNDTFWLYVENNSYCFDRYNGIVPKCNGTAWIGLSEKQIRFIYDNWDYIKSVATYGKINVREQVKLIKLIIKWINFK